MTWRLSGIVMLAGALAGAVLTAAPSAVAATRPAQARAEVRPAAGALAGRVLGPGGAGLGGICVLAKGSGGIKLAGTAANGRYQLTALAPGRYTITYEDCRDPGAYFSARPGGVTVPAGALARLRTVSLRSARPEPLHPVLPPTGTTPVVSGTVRSAASGKGLNGICVRAWNPQGTKPAALTRTTTGGQYSFSASMLKPGRYKIAFSTGCGNSGNYAPQWWDEAPAVTMATVVQIGSDTGLAGINASLGTGGSISGIVRGKVKGRPGIRGICVAASGAGQGIPSDNSYEQTVTGKGGRYSITGLASGTYQVQFDPTCDGSSPPAYLPGNYPHPVKVMAGHDTGGIGIVLPKGGTISGIVTAASSGKPLEGICVLAANANANGNGSININIGLAASNRTGHYRTTPLGPGHYVLLFVAGLCGNTGSYAEQLNGGQSFPARTVPVAVSENVTGVNARMRPGGTIEGTLTSFSGSPLNFACVTATDQADWAGAGDSPIGLAESGSNLFVVTTATTGRSGSYQIANLTPGLYNLSFSNCEDPAPDATEWFNPHGGSGPAWIAVTGGQPVRASMALGRSGSISGVVRSTGGQPLRNVCPEAFGFGGQVPYLDVVPYRNGPITSKDGQYTLHGLAPGRYRVEFTDCSASRNYPSVWSKSAGIKVRAGHDSAGIDAVFAPGLPVTGTVTSAATGNPVRSECVQLIGNSQDFGNVVETNAAGQYRLSVGPGRHELGLYACGRGNSFASALKLVTVTSSGASASVALPGAGELGGVVRSGQPGICVEAFPVTSPGLEGIASTVAHGRYSMAGLAAGTYRVLFSPVCDPVVSSALDYVAAAPRWFPSVVRITSGRTTTGVSATLAADGAIAGTVTRSGVCVVATPATASAATPVLSESVSGGRFEISRLTPGRYRVEFTGGCGATHYRTRQHSGTVRVTAGKTTRI